MKSLKELEEYIELRAKEHAEDNSIYEWIEIDTYREIIKFCLGKGFTIDQIDFEVFLNGIDEENEEIEDKDSWYYFDKIAEFIENVEDKNEIPSYVKHLHNFWVKAFWPEYKSE